jgi:L-fuculose-phosphate aldolase
MEKRSTVRLHDDLIGAAREMLRLGLVTGTFGNVSARSDLGILITPSGFDYGRMRPADLVLLDPRGEVLRGERAPSSEFRLHVAIYRRLPAVEAIVHTHSRSAVALGRTASRLSGGALVGPVPVAPFRLAGSQELADRAADLLVSEEARAIILQDHGVVGVGRAIFEALEVCVAVERAAERALAGGS